AGIATLTVTRDYGTERLASASEEDPSASETVIRFLDRETDLTTRYGGGFVQSIDRIAGDERGGRRFDWFFYVNGVESSVGGADADSLRVLVGPWVRIREDAAAAQLQDGPSTSGVFARFEGTSSLVALNAAGDPVPVDPGSGLVAALRDGDHPPTWLVTAGGD